MISGVFCRKVCKITRKLHKGSITARLRVVSHSKKLHKITQITQNYTKLHKITHFFKNTLKYH